MKQKRLILLAAAVAVMLAACEPENVVTPEPEPTPSGPTYLTSLVGTVWNCHEDYWMEDVPYVGTMHVLMDTDLSFLTDSTGIRRSYGPGAENFPAADLTYNFYYRYDTLTCLGFIEDSGSASIIDFQYNLEQDAIFYLSNGKKFIRVQ